MKHGICIGVEETINVIKGKEEWLKYVIITSGTRYVVEIIDKDTEEVIDIKYIKDEGAVQSITNDEEYDCNIVPFHQWFMRECQDNDIRLYVVGDNTLILNQFAKGFDGCVGLNNINIC